MMNTHLSLYHSSIITTWRLDVEKLRVASMKADLYNGKKRADPSLTCGRKER